MTQFLAWVVLFIIIATIDFIVRRIPARAALGFFIALPLLATAHWLIDGNEMNFTPFMYARFYLAFFALIFIQWMKATNTQDKYGIFYWILLINIGEAVVAELSNGSSIIPNDTTWFGDRGIKEFNNGSIFNTFAGVALILTMPGASNFKIVQNGDKMEAQYPISVLWLIGFTLWSLTFAYGYIQANSSPIIVFDLGIPLLLAYKRRELYMQYYAFVLSMIMLLWTSPITREYLIVKTQLFIPWLYISFIFITMFFSFYLLLQSWDKDDGSIVSKAKRLVFKE